MSTVLTRSPLEPIGMNGAGTQKRRSARLSQESVEDNEPPSKKTKVNGTTTTTTKVETKERDGDNDAMSKKRPKKSYETEIDGFAFSKGTRGRKTKESKQPPVRHSTAERESPAVVAESSKRTEPAEIMPPPPKPVSEPALASVGTQNETPVPKTARKNFRRLPTTPERETAGKSVRRSKRISDEHAPNPPPQQSPHRPAHAQSHANADRSPSPDKFRPVTVEKKRKRGPGGAEEERKTMRINLPSWDTPVIKKNKEMRKSSADGSRRSSSGMRGRRASSLIDEGRGNGKQSEVSFRGEGPSPRLVKVERLAGTTPSELDRTGVFDRSGGVTMALPTPDTEKQMDLSRISFSSFLNQPRADENGDDAALPHAEVFSADFYKHIPADIPEPRRMKILLGWCAERALPPKPDAPTGETAHGSLEYQSRAAARHIQEELSKDFVLLGSLSDWFSRDESVPAVPLKKRPNPRNVTNAAKAEELEKELERLKQERAEWESLSKSVPAPTEEVEDDGQLSPLHPELLDSPQRSILEQLQAPMDAALTDPDAIQKRISDMAENLEFTVDQFAHGVHTLATTKETAERLADRTLAEAATVMEERDKAKPRTVDGMNSLKALGKLLNSRLR